MRNPTLHLVGITTSPGGGEGGGGVFGGSKAEEELRHWLETRLDALGIDPVAYSRFVLSLLRRPDSALTPPGEEVVAAGKGGLRRSRARPRNKPPPLQQQHQGDREQRRAVIQCLTSAADHKCGVESLVDELCEKLRDLEGGDSKEEEEPEVQSQETKAALESLTPRDRALRYYAAFPALQPSTPKKFPHRKDRNSATTNNNNNNNNCNNRNKSVDNKNKNNSNNSKGRHRKTKISIQNIEPRMEEKEGYGFAKSMELEREKEQDLDLDQLRLAQLQAKFDESLEALWDSGPGNTQGTDSIWAAPSLSIPSGPLWPSDAAETPFAIPASEGYSHAINTPYQESIVDDSPLIPLDIEWFSIEDSADEPLAKDNNAPEYNVTWSDSIVEGPWCWRGFSRNLTALSQSPHTSSCFFPVAPCKSTAVSGKESRSKKVNSLPDPDEDLLTSVRTHFRPIKDDGHWADGTTFPVNNSVERVAYRRSESGNLLYLPGGESPYMEYRESASPPLTVATNLTLKFRVRQCDKCVQTEPLRSPIKRRILCEAGNGSEESEPEKKSDDDVADNDNDDDDDFKIERLGCEQSGLLLHNERKRRHSSSFRCRTVAALCPLSL